MLNRVLGDIGLSPLFKLYFDLSGYAVRCNYSIKINSITIILVKYKTKKEAMPLFIF